MIAEADGVILFLEVVVEVIEIVEVTDDVAVYV